jgi:hypothetical protein
MNLVKAAVEGRLPRGIGVERLREVPADDSSKSSDFIRNNRRGAGVRHSDPTGPLRNGNFWSGDRGRK